MRDRREWINSLREDAGKNGNTRICDLALANLLEAHEDHGERGLGDHIFSLLKACFFAAGQSSNDPDKAFLFCLLILTDIHSKFNDARAESQK